MKASTKREQLIRERVAEEALRNTYSLARKIEHLSVWSNFIASVAVLTQADSNEAKLLGVSAAIGSFLPYLFPYRWETTYLRHESYKKKIYGPITGAGLMFNEETKNYPRVLCLATDFELEPLASKATLSFALKPWLHHDPLHFISCE